MTAATSKIPGLREKLRKSGITASEIGLYGRFHSRSNLAELDWIVAFCDSHPEFQFKEPSALATATRSNLNGEVISQGALQNHALRSILVEPPQWYKAFCNMRDARLQHKNGIIVSFGTERSVPFSLNRIYQSQIVHFADVDLQEDVVISSNDIAVIGMSCKVAGADNLDEFWELICAAKSQHQEITEDRLDFQTPFRDADSKHKWFGNFINGAEMFDHKFFKKSPRESATMDPQQRHILQIAYQAVEQSGYFQKSSHDPRVGCYIGVRGADYYDNIACYPPNAFAATGNLQAFIAGKISHYFGWIGPGMCIDTACSSSLVAVHQACRAIINGECTAALAGGTHIMTSPLWFQNLAAASFLSPTGQCKPFDTKGDGYCRGDGIAAVFLKKLSAAIADGDEIIGVISGSAVQQNLNCTPIFVPNAPSLADLFQDVLHQAHLKPGQISVVEAHGTGTAVGDPAEYEGIKQSLGGSHRTKPLLLGSVKGLIGHTECASGIISVIKVLLMIQRGIIPPQASFSKINPSINASSADQITIPTSERAWNVERRAALINNYGASGSNASIILTQSPFTRRKSPSIKSSHNSKYPFWFCGYDDNSLNRYIKALLNLFSRTSADISISDLSFNVERQSNRLLDRALMFSADSVDQLKQKLIAFEQGATELKSITRPEPAPVVLCFGGQVSTFVGLDKTLFDRVPVVRNTIQRVDAVARTLGSASIFPGIFEKTPVGDVVQLQTMLFATQYAIAQTWIESGVQPVALVGHSFGELTALCVSQVLSLADAVKMVVIRATRVRDDWGNDSGAMMAVEANLNEVEKLLAESNKTHPGIKPATIACYNGPTSFTIAGPTAAIDGIADTMQRSNFASMKSKRLNVTNSFHCVLVDPLLENIENDLEGLTFQAPTIPLESAVESPEQVHHTPRFVADHIRQPVYFHQAVKRISEKYPRCIFLEAGSASGVVSMASRALGNPSESHFQAVNVTCDDAMNKLTDATLNLWRAGRSTKHWTNLRPQEKGPSRYHQLLLLPPYQFEQAPHWMAMKSRPAAVVQSVAASTPPAIEKLPDTLLTFAGYHDQSNSGNGRVAKFRVNTMIPKYDELLSGHIIAQTAPICPATVQIGLILDAIQELEGGAEPAGTRGLQIQAVDYISPVCVNPVRALWIDIAAKADSKRKTWTFEVYSTKDSEERMGHTTGRILFSVGDSVENSESSLQRDFSQFERLFPYQHCIDLLNGNSADVDDVLQCRTIYRLFSEIVQYGEEYRGIQKLVSKDNLSSAYIIRTSHASKDSKSNKFYDAHLADGFCQVGGIWVNCIADRPPNDIFIANGIESWMRSSKFSKDNQPDAFHVFAVHSRPTEKTTLTDVFIFDAAMGQLVEVILGIGYIRIPRLAMTKLLSRLTGVQGSSQAAAHISQQAKSELLSAKPAPVSTAHERQAVVPKMEIMPKQPKPRSKEPSRKDEIAMKVKLILADLSGLELHEIKDGSDLADLGIDSLVGMEMAHEIESAYNITLPQDELADITHLTGLISCVVGALGYGGDAVEKEDESYEVESDQNSTKSDLPRSVSSVATGTTTPTSAESERDAKTDFSRLLSLFHETKRATDGVVAEYGQEEYFQKVLPLQNELSIALTLEAFEHLGIPLREIPAGQKVARVPFQKEHRFLVDYLYKMLEKETQGILVDGENITRTTVQLPLRSSKDIIQDLLQRFPDQSTADNLTFFTGSKLAEVLSGKTDGIKLIFGSKEGRELVSQFYADWPLNQVLYKLMGDFLVKFTSGFDQSQGPLKILEMGAGTGGTTKRLVPLLASLGVPIEYTFTDLAPSLVAAARKKFSKDYPFMKFRAHDIEKTPDNDLLGTQHIILASNAIHATHSLVTSTSNVRKALRPDGFLLMLEMTRTPYWVDMTFGLFEGWWLFDDGRSHALTHESRWEKDLHEAGYGHVDWTEGTKPESDIEKLIMATASGSRYQRSEIPKESTLTDCAARQAMIDEYVHEFTDGFKIRENLPAGSFNDMQGKCVLLTGATGSLGAHLVAKAALQHDVRRIFCLNRRSKQDPRERQHHALIEKGIFLPNEAAAKLSVLETDMSKPKLGLQPAEYEDLANSVTHIIHSAWSMAFKWSVKRFKPQFQILSNLIDLACVISEIQPPGLVGSKVTFQFVSSIATVGHWPIWTSNASVPEERMEIQSVMPLGYAEAKFVCERMLDATLHQHPGTFRTMSVRLGQIAGSTVSGYWNRMEHVSFLIKSSQTLNALPDFDGLCSWTPVDDVAGTLMDIAMLPEQVAPYVIYHIDNPIRQSWKNMIIILSDAMGIQRERIIPFKDWVQLVRDFPKKPGPPEGPDGDNPASLLIDFLNADFERMSCGGVLLGTVHAREHSTTLANLGAVSESTVSLFLKSWKDTGFLK